MTPLKNDTTGHGYCGPVAVACLTGKPLSEVLDAIREKRGWRSGMRKPSIRGTQRSELEYAFEKFGYRMIDLGRVKSQCGLDPYAPMPTLAYYLRKRRAELRNATLLIEVTGHWVAVTGRKFVDTLTKGQPVWLREAPGRRKRVRRVHQIVKI